MTRWLKDVLLDVVALSLILIFAFTGNHILDNSLVYTILLVTGKVLYFSFNYLQKKLTPNRSHRLFIIVLI